MLPSDSFMTLKAAVVAVLVSWLPAQAQERVVVFAASSLQLPLDALAETFEAETGTQVSLSYAGSSTLARQIAKGAGADLFISANLAWADWLAEEHLTPLARAAPLSNRLVVVSRGGTPFTLTEFPKTTGRIAIAFTEAVPAGVYAREAFETLGLWAELAPRMVETDNARAATALVDMGAVPYGVVYASDLLSSELTVLADIPSEAHSEIAYPIVLLTEEAREFFTYLQTPAALEIFAQNGFIVDAR